MTPEDTRRMYRAMTNAILDDPNGCPQCGGWKGERADICWGCRSIAQDTKEREELLR